MDADGLPLIGPSVDYRKVEPINQKKTLSFLNHFVMHTAGFLNHFSSICEEKLSHLSTRIQRLETQMTLLEGKLSSVPGLDQVTAAAQPTATTQQQPQQAPQQNAVQQTQPGSGIQQNITVNQSAQINTQQEEDVKKDIPVVEDKPKQTVSHDPQYAKFFKMLGFGVPSRAVKQKMELEGLDPTLLDTPNAPLPGGQTSSPANKDDSDSLFSDDDQGDDSSDVSSTGFSD